MDKQRCFQATSTPAIATSMNVVAGGVVQDDGLNIKEEWADADLDIGPTVLQHMDARYRPVQSDVSIIKQESRIKDNNMNAILCGGVKEEIIEDDRRADTDDQRRNKAAQSKQRARSQLYSCDKCGKTYAAKPSLLAHNRNLHSKKSHKCTKCNKKFPSKAYLYQHTIQVHSEQQYECAVCKKIYGSKRGLSLHVYQDHRARPAVSSPVIYTCDYCHKTYSTKQGLVQHIEVVHTKVRYRCSECNKEFTGKLSLQAHVRRVHSKEKHESLQIHTCEYCQKTFRYKSTLRRHTKHIHVATHIHRCRRCDENFESNEVLQRHNTSIHAQYKCQVCLKVYKTIRTLRRHYKKAHNSKDIQFQPDVHPHAMPDLRLTADVTSAAASTSKQQHNVDVVKEEPADGELELGPVVFQHMDCNYRPYEEEPQDNVWGLM